MFLLILKRLGQVQNQLLKFENALTKAVSFGLCSESRIQDNNEGFYDKIFPTFDALNLKNLSMKKVIISPNVPAPIGPYSQGLLVGDVLYLSGQIALDPTTNKVIKGHIKEETKMVMDYLKAVLKAADMDFNNVVKATIFLMDMNNFVHVNEVYASYFTKDFPARATIQAARLPKDANVEISMEARKI